MHMDPLMPALVGIVFVILALALLLRRFRQPSVVAYLLTGVVLGPNRLGIVTDATTVARLGEIGVVLLLFFDLPPEFRTIGNVTDCLFGTVRKEHEEEPI